MPNQIVNLAVNGLAVECAWLVMHTLSLITSLVGLALTVCAPLFFVSPGIAYVDAVRSPQLVQT